MITETKINNEYYSNGILAYTETIGILSKHTQHLYPNRRIHPDGYSWIRIGTNAKYFDNRQLAWELKYDNEGSIIKTDSKQYRKDGSIITV